MFSLDTNFLVYNSPRIYVVASTGLNVNDLMKPIQ